MAKNFEGEIKNDTLCFRAERCGLKGDGKTDDLPALNRLLAHAAGLNRPVKILFRRGRTYRIDGRTGDKYQRIFLNRMQGMVLDGNGCTLSVHPASRAFAVYRSKDIVIRDFRIDYFPLPYTQGRVTKAEPERYYLEFEVEKDYPLPVEGDETYYKGGKMVDCITANGRSRKFYVGHSWVKKVQSLGGRKYGVTYALRDQAQLRPGDFFCMKVEHPANEVPKLTDTADKSALGEWFYTDFGSIEALETDGLLLEDITSYASPVMTFLLRGCSRHEMRRCAIVGKDGRIVASNSDGVHLKGNEHQPRIVDCRFERLMDDAIHTKISGDIITEVLSPTRFRICHMDIGCDNTNLAEGLTVMVFDREKNRQLAMCRIADYEPLNFREGIATLDTPVNEAAEGTSLYLQAEGRAEITRCRFGTQLQRAILTHHPTTVSDCHIADTGMGFDLGLMSGGIEGPPTQHLRVERCRIERLTWSGLNIDCPSTDYDQKSRPQLELIDNTFRLPEGVPVLRAKDSWGVSLVGNTFREAKDIPRDSLFHLRNTPLIRDEGNRYVK